MIVYLINDISKSYNKNLLWLHYDYAKMLIKRLLLQLKDFQKQTTEIVLKKPYNSKTQNNRQFKHLKKKPIERLTNNLHFKDF